MQIQEVINHIAAGNSAEAKESIENVLSAKAFDALQGRKQEMAATLFGGQEQSDEEVTDDEEAYAEDVEHDEEQLDEVSLKLASNTYRNRMASRGGPTDRDPVKLHKAQKTAARMEKKFGSLGASRVKRINAMD